MTLSHAVTRSALALVAVSWLDGAAAQEGPTFKEIMQGLAEDMNHLNAAILVEDFEAIERSVHGGAGEMADAAREGGMDSVLRYHARVNAGLVSCHAAFRDELTQTDAPKP